MTLHELCSKVPDEANLRGLSAFLLTPAAPWTFKDGIWFGSSGEALGDQYPKKEVHTYKNDETREWEMPQGKVKWFNNAKGYGFIIEDGEDEDLFAHFSSIQMEGYKTLKAGQTVAFEKQPSDKGIHAVNIVPVDKRENAISAPEKPADREAEDPASQARSAEAAGF